MRFPQFCPSLNFDHNIDTIILFTVIVTMGYDGPMDHDGSMGQWVRMGQWVMGHVYDGSWVTKSDPWSTLRIIRVPTNQPKYYIPIIR